jgi:hypothetical protein
LINKAPPKTVTSLAKNMHIHCENYHVKVVRDTNSRVKSKRKGR